MPNLQLEVYYEIEGLRLDADALGSTVMAYNESEVVVRLVLPDAPDSFTIPRFRGRLTISNHDPDPRDDVTTVALLHSGDKYEVRILRAVANTEADTFQQVRDRLLEATRTAVTNFTEWVWVRNGQVWNAPSGEYPKRISPVSLFNIDDSTGGSEVTAKDLPMRILPSSTEVSESDLSEISRLCIEVGRPSLAELLLAEGGHYLWRSERLAPDRAVLMAAIACELAIKTSLRELADPDDLPWVDLVIKNPTDVSITAVNLWHQAIKAATGHSLSEENGALYKRLQRLISKRNGIVHRSEHVDAAEAKNLVGAAVEAFDWLRTIDHRVGHSLSPSLPSTSGASVNEPREIQISPEITEKTKRRELSGECAKCHAELRQNRRGEWIGLGFFWQHLRDCPRGGRHEPCRIYIYEKIALG